MSSCKPPPQTPSTPLDWRAEDLTDAALVARLPGFRDDYADLDTVRIHFVEGGQGDPLVLLSGWPQTWWSYHAILPELARFRRGIVIDLRGQGGSSKPDAGYDKQTLGEDVLAVARQLGHARFDIAGHDIGAMAAYSLAANHPEAIRRLALLDVPHPFEGLARIPLVPQAGAYDLDNPDRGAHPWWLAFNQIPGLPETLLEGRTDLLLDWIFDYLSRTADAPSPFDRAVYKAAMAAPGALRAGNRYYQAFARDLHDIERYGVLQMPVLGLGGINFHVMEVFVQRYCAHYRLQALPGIGHWLVEERPAETAAALLAFFQAEPESSR